MCGLFVATAAAFVGGALREPASAESPPAYVHVDQDGLRYSFDAMSGRARLVRINAPDIDLSATQPDLAASLRKVLESRIGMSLGELTERHASTADALRRLGYL